MRFSHDVPGVAGIFYEATKQGGKALRLRSGPL